MKKIAFISAALILGCIIQVQGQNRQVTGTIKCSNDCTPMCKVSVLLKGTTIGTASGENGNFSLKIPERYNSSNTLCFSSVGMKSREVRIANREQYPINVSMDADIVHLAEVTIVYDTLTRQSRTYLTPFRQDPVIELLVHITESLQADDRFRNLR
jgi:hypothetical protein